MTPEETGPDLHDSTTGTLMEVGWGSVVTLCRDRDTGNSSSGKQSLVCTSRRLPLVPPNSLQAPVLHHLRPNNQQGRNTAAPPISRLVA